MNDLPNLPHGYRIAATGEPIGHGFGYLVKGDYNGSWRFIDFAKWESHKVGKGDTWICPIKPVILQS